MSPKLRWGLALAAFFSTLSPRESIADRPSDSKPLNVLLICVDDLKPTLGSYGDTFAITPNIDALADRGVQFNNAYCNQAVCAPSRNALMTSLRPQTIGVYDLATYFRKAAPDAVTLGQHLIAHGYESHSLGKIYHKGQGNVIDPETFSEKPWSPKTPTYATQEANDQIRVDDRGKKRGPATERGDVGDEDYADGKIASEAIRRLEGFKQNPNQPFFLGVGFIRPHLPFVAPAKYWDAYDSLSIPMPKVTTDPQDAPRYARTNFGELLAYTDFQGSRTVNAEQSRRLIHGYYAATSYADAQIGRVISALDRLEMSDHTIIVLWGDHGWHLGDHSMWCKHTNYEQANRIPLIVAHPNSAKGIKTRAMVETVDLYPTICDLVGLPTPTGLDGRSFSDVTRGESDEARPYVTHVYPRGQRLGHAIRDPRYRLVRWSDFSGKDAKEDLELYDYQSDPLETQNMVSENPEETARLIALIEAQPKPKMDYRLLQRNSAKVMTEPRKASKKPFDRKEGFTRRDKNRDGFLSFDEFMSTQPDSEKAKQRFPIFDKDHDGKLSADEFIRPERSK